MAWSDCILNPVSCAAKKAGGAAADSAWESFLRWSAQGLSDLSATVFNEFSTSTAPRFDQAWWRDNLNLMVAVSLPILVAVFVLQCITAVVRREPGQLGRALVGAFIGTAGVPIAVGVVAACGRAADEISLAILGNHVTADGYKRMTDISAVLAVGTAGGYVLVAVLLGLIALFSLYFVMLLREVALLAFVVFAPIALVGWTWSATRHWLRRWAEVVGALLFSKVAMATVFTLGLSAIGGASTPGQGDQSNGSNLGTFLAGVLLIAIAAFTPMVTFSFIHWAGDQGYAAVRAMQQGSQGVAAARDHIETARQWRADHFGAKQDTGSTVIDSQPDSKGGRDEGNSQTDSQSGIGTAPNEVAQVATAEHSRDTGRDRADSAVSAATPSSLSGTGTRSGSDGTPVAFATATATTNEGTARDVGGPAPQNSGGPEQPSPPQPAGTRYDDVPGPTHTKET